jgi:hypothetical protein
LQSLQCVFSTWIPLLYWYGISFFLREKNESLPLKFHFMTIGVSIHELLKVLRHLRDSPSFLNIKSWKIIISEKSEIFIQSVYDLPLGAIKVLDKKQYVSSVTTLIPTVNSNKQCAICFFNGAGVGPKFIGPISVQS